MAHYELATPITEQQVRALRVNDTVTLQKTLFGLRDATLIHLFDRGRTTRFDLRGHAVIHTAPNVKQVPRSQRASCRLRAAVHRHDDVGAYGALHARSDVGARRSHHYRQGRDG